MVQGKLCVSAVRGLGQGLDEAAEQAANEIRFKPAVGDGQPPDSSESAHSISWFESSTSTRYEKLLSIADFALLVSFFRVGSRANGESGDCRHAAAI